MFIALLVSMTYLYQAEELCEGDGESVIRDEASDPKGEYGDEIDNEPSLQIPTKGYEGWGWAEREKGAGGEREGGEGERRKVIIVSMIARGADRAPT